MTQTEAVEIQASGGHHRVTDISSLPAEGDADPQVVDVHHPFVVLHDGHAGRRDPQVLNTGRPLNSQTVCGIARVVSGNSLRTMSALLSSVSLDRT